MERISGKIEIDKGIDVPPRKMPPGAAAKYPWKHMQPGDSFFVPFDDKATTPQMLQARVGGSARKHFKRCCTRQVDGGIRVWRLE